MANDQPLAEPQVPEALPVENPVIINPGNEDFGIEDPDRDLPPNASAQKKAALRRGREYIFEVIRHLFETQDKVVLL